MPKKFKNPTSLWSKIEKNSGQFGASKRVSGASERANGRANGPVLTSEFFSIFDHSVPVDYLLARVANWDPK